MPDLFTIRGVLGELAGYDALPITMLATDDGFKLMLSGTPTQLMAQLEELTADAEIVSFVFTVPDGK